MVLLMSSTQLVNAAELRLLYYWKLQPLELGIMTPLLFLRCTYSKLAISKVVHESNWRGCASGHQTHDTDRLYWGMSCQKAGIEIAWLTPISLVAFSSTWVSGNTWHVGDADRSTGDYQLAGPHDRLKISTMISAKGTVHKLTWHFLQANTQVQITNESLPNCSTHLSFLLS